MNFKPSLIELEKIGNSSLGFITIANCNNFLPFEVKRVYWTYYTPNDVNRGGHSHKELNQIIFAVSGSISFNTEDRYGNKDLFVLDKPNIGLYLPNNIWRDIQFSHNAVLLCLASEIYKEDDYIRNYTEFRKWIEQMY